MSYISKKQAKELFETAVLDLIDNCSHCWAKVHIVWLHMEYHTHANGDIEYYGIFRCKPCQKLLVKTYQFKANPYGGDLFAPIGWKQKFPAYQEDFLKQDEEYIPEDVLSDFHEALSCKSIWANKASCSMFRRALQNSLINLGANTSKDLKDQIQELKSLQDDLKDWAHQIRIFWNWGAHPDKDNLKTVTKEDVDEVYDFVTKFFTYVFVMPEKVKKSRVSRDLRVEIQ